MLDNFVDTLANRYADFNGRATRKEYWLFILMFLIFEMLFMGFMLLLFQAQYMTLYWIVSAIFWIFVVAMIVPMLAAMIRRLHDMGKKGTWFLITFVPAIGSIWLLVLLCQPSQQGVNQFG